DADVVAQSIYLPSVLPSQKVPTFDESIVVISHCGDVDHALDEMLDELDKETKRSHTGDVALEFIAHLVRHELDLLPLQQLTLRIVRPAFHVGGMTRCFWKLVGPVFATLVGQELLPHGPERTMNDEVRVSPYRRGEMGIARRGQPEMSEVLGGV